MRNAAAQEHWSGDAGAHWAAEAARYDRMNRHAADRIVATVAARPGERVLDVGCGNGALALTLAAQVGDTGTVVGLDVSPPMLAVARRRAAERHVHNVAFRHGDAQVADAAAEPFDALVSRFGVMFFDDPPAAFANLARALRPEGRLVVTCWQDMALNDWVTVPAAAALEHVPLPTGLDQAADHGAFSLADPAATTALLEGAGFTDVTVTAMAERMWMGSSVEDTVGFMRTTEFADVLFTGVAPTQAEAGWAAVADALTSRLTDDGVELGGAAWLITARRS